mmetsp:Transcript_15181/g.48230  ORF Transcript_15181/g.48230 Transcript_15181/m.48230 type:complete len:219 (+) Transcript_15181:1942-2598(+)
MSQRSRPFWPRVLCRTRQCGSLSQMRTRRPASSFLWSGRRLGRRGARCERRVRLRLRPRRPNASPPRSHRQTRAPSLRPSPQKLLPGAPTRGRSRLWRPRLVRRRRRRKMSLLPSRRMLSSWRPPPPRWRPSRSPRRPRTWRLGWKSTTLSAMLETRPRGRPSPLPIRQLPRGSTRRRRRLAQQVLMFTQWTRRTSRCSCSERSAPRLLPSPRDATRC